MVRHNTAKRKVLVAASTAHSAHLRGIVRYARENDWHLTMDMAYTGAYPRDWRGDGVLALAPFQPAWLAHIEHSGVPCVTSPRTDGSLRFPCVEEDNFQIGQIAADHFLERAYRSYAWAPSVNDQANHERLLGFQTRLTEHGFKCYLLPPAHTCAGPDWHDSWIEYQRSLIADIQQLPRPTAIFSFNDCIAANLIDVCRDSGLSVPEEFAILGVDNDPIVCDSASVPLSSVEPNHEDMAYRAAAVLDSLMDGEVPPAAVISVPPRGVVTRVSTNASAVENPRVARALSYIAETYHNPMLGVLDVADAVGLSRRHLERCFREVTGHTVNEHIVMARMYEASRLLTMHTRAKCSEVAALVGLGGERAFFRTFRRFFGMSPKAHREWAVCGGSSHPMVVSKGRTTAPTTPCIAAEPSAGAAAQAFPRPSPERFSFAHRRRASMRDRDLPPRVVGAQETPRSTHLSTPSYSTSEPSLTARRNSTAETIRSA